MSVAFAKSGSKTAEDLLGTFMRLAPKTGVTTRMVNNRANSFIFNYKVIIF